MLQRPSATAIVIRGARQNNLKNLTLELLPYGAFNRNADWVHFLLR
jgi:hypothetical protein